MTEPELNLQDSAVPRYVNILLYAAKSVQFGRTAKTAKAALLLYATIVPTALRQLLI